MFKIPDTPDNLCFFISRISERKNHVIVNLSKRGAMAIKVLHAFTISIQYSLISFRSRVSIQDRSVGPKLKLILE